MVLFNQHQMHDIDSTHWVDFSNSCDNSRNSTAFANAAMDGKPYRRNANDDEMMKPPALSLPFDHYCVIAENVFISFLKSYRSLYSTKAEADSALKAVKDVIVLGNRLEAFLTVVLPFHKEYGTVHRKRETCRIHDMTLQLGDYHDPIKTYIMMYLFLDGNPNDVEGHYSDNSQARSDDISSDSSVFEDIELQYPEKELNLSASDDTFCSSEGTGIAGVTMLEMSSDEEQSSHGHSSDTFDTNNGMTWDDCSVMSQVGNKCSSNTENHHEDEAYSFVVPLKNGMSINAMMPHDSTHQTTSIPTKVSSAQDSKFDGDDKDQISRKTQFPPSIPTKVSSAQDSKFDGDDKDQISRKTQFDLLMKHWREKERELSNRKQVKPIRKYNVRPNANSSKDLESCET